MVIMVFGNSHPVNYADLDNNLLAVKSENRDKKEIIPSTCLFCGVSAVAVSFMDGPGILFVVGRAWSVWRSFRFGECII